MVTCSACGQQNPDDARFCNGCASPLRVEERPLSEERKTVTVVFVDLVGFTARAERLDPEDVRGLLGPYHAHVRRELERRGGTVEKFIGDAVMAVFGAPAAHEDDPERAVRAALAIRDWSAEQADLQVRVAVNTGEALVNVGARPAEGEAMVAGDVVNTAARMQAAAPVNGVLVGEATYRATRDQEENAAVAQHLAQVLRPDLGVLAPLRRLAEEFELAAVSSSGLMRLDVCFRAVGLAELFPAGRRFSAEDSLPVPRSKPAPDVYLQALLELEATPDEATAVEDSVAGVTAAAAAGIRTIGNLVFAPDEERRARAAALVEAGAELLADNWAQLARRLESEIKSSRVPT